MLSAQQLADPLRKGSMDIAPSTALQVAERPSRGRHAPLAGGRDGLRAVAPTKGSVPSRMIVKMLERKCLRHIEAVHHRDFFEDGAIWTDKSESWEAELPFVTEEQMPLPEYVKAWQVLARRYPDYGLHCIEMSTLIEGSSACTHANLEVTGMPPGVVRRNVSIARFELVDGKWLATKFTTLPS
ncbi:hypothetical protein DOTSEDRAFT_70474 [Dothistroma septosporum NZE10]|uniref:SnoaL-like domain-containing protein n=1 Tax=Dothistroma septosporum (strain NZE10 / CBS 128990) TaxID=675120 RepID=N1PSQ1_DOTSN|nr:hypothetical protein DOTSEDRAFT_70474 [Dothistroma septosporum NZE10]